MRKYIIKSSFVIVLLLFYFAIIDNGKIEENTIYIFIKNNIYDDISIGYFLAISFIVTISFTSYLIFCNSKEFKKNHRSEIFYKLFNFLLIVLLIMEIFYLFIYSFLFNISTFIK